MNILIPLPLNGEPGSAHKVISEALDGYSDQKAEQEKVQGGSRPDPGWVEEARALRKRL